MEQKSIALSRSQIQTTALARHKAFKSIRAFFDERDYLEIDAPLLIPANAVESHIDPLFTMLSHVDGSELTQRFLMTSPEIHMKRLLSSGLRKIYFLGHVFRDREHSPIHRNEFSMLEWYRTESQLEDLISECEVLFQQLAISIAGTPMIGQSPDQEINFSQPFERISVAQAWGDFAGIDLISCLEEIANGNEQALPELLRKKGESLRENSDFDDHFAHIMLKYVEPRIGKERPCVLYDWPAQTAALAALRVDNPLIAMRFEIYCGGVELANAFAELTNSKEQRKRFTEANMIRTAHGKKPLPISEAFLTDLEKMPAACGIAVGIDRLLAVILAKKDLREITPFAE